jgi:hypothetical protein
MSRLPLGQRRRLDFSRLRRYSQTQPWSSDSGEDSKVLRGGETLPRIARPLSSLWVVKQRPAPVNHREGESST